MLKINGKPFAQPAMKVVINKPETTVIIGDEFAKQLMSKSNYRKTSAERNNEENIKFVINNFRVNGDSTQAEEEKSDTKTVTNNSLQVKKATDDIEIMARQFSEETSHSITYESFPVSSGEGHYSETTRTPGNSSSSSSAYSSSSSCSDSKSDSEYYTKEVIMEESDEINTDYL